MTHRRDQQSSSAAAAANGLPEHEPLATPEPAGLFERTQHRLPPPVSPPRRSLRRAEQHRGAAADGSEVPDRLSVRLERLWQRAITSERERAEAELEARLLLRPQITRTNLLAIVSPKGGVGKTTCSYLIGDLLVSRPGLRVLVADANPDFGTLAKLAPDSRRSPYQLTDVIAEMDRIRTVAELDPYLSMTQTGLHLLAAPQSPQAMEEMTPEAYGRLLAFLGRYYHLIVLDLGTGLTEPLARFALERADQAVVVTTSDWITSSTVLDALDYVLAKLGGHQLTMAINKAPGKIDLAPLESKLRGHHIPRHVVIPYDEQLKQMLDKGTYVCERLERRTRLAVKQLAHAAHEQLA